VSTQPGREQNWYPISKLGWFTGHIREGVEAARRQLELLQPALARPYLGGFPGPPPPSAFSCAGRCRR
jgi:hypothetical protein